MISLPLSAVFFDLDGTLVDTAPDMAAALNRLLEEEGQARRAFADIRPQVSRGSTGLLHLGFGATLPADRDAGLRRRFLEIYAEELCVHSTPFPGVLTLLRTIEINELPWGIVTNKPAWLAEPLLRHLGLLERSSSTVCGDTLPHSKPHPMPLLNAASQTGVLPGRCVYVGDDQRDIVAGRAAGMATVAALYGYIPPDAHPGDWGADACITSPGELPGLILMPPGGARRNHAGHDA